MTINYNRTGADRKPLVIAISAITGAEAKYLGAPTFAYQVDYFSIDHNGGVSFDDRADSEEVENLIERLHGMGFEANPMEGQDAAELEAAPAGEGGGLTIQMPTTLLPSEALVNLTSLLTAKGRLIRKALGVEALPVEVSPDTVSFPWFEGRDLDADEVKTYTHLIASLCEMARTQKRIAAKDRDTENDKYAFRCFLLRLGFIGAEFKTERKILLRNLSGNSAFKSGDQRKTA